MAYARNLEQTHSRWACAHSYGIDASCSISCTCSCHGDGHAEQIRRQGLHVHEWRVRIYLLQDQPDKLSIRCNGCRMYIPRDAMPQVVQP